MAIRNWSMPDSSYDTDANPAYFAIKQSAIEFHSMLKSRTELIGRNSEVLEIKHFDQALKEAISTLNRNNRSTRGFIANAIAELMLVVGGAAIMPLATEIYDWLGQSTRGSLAPSSEAILVAILGVFLILFKFTLNYIK